MTKLLCRPGLFARFLVASVLLAFGVAHGGASSPASPQTLSASPKPASTRLKFEALASQLEFFDLRPFLYDRAELDFAPADARAGARYFRLLNQGLDPGIPVAEIVPLCHDANAKVRTLALAALFQRNDPHLLPLIMELTGDSEPTFPGYAALAPPSFFPSGVGLPPQKQTVGKVASAMVNFYMEPAGFHYGVAGTRGEPGFEVYWAQRKSRRFCASWFSVELARACRGTSPMPSQYRSDIRALRKQIDALPDADRDWTLLHLNGEDGSEFLASESDLIAAAKRRGADALLAVLREKIPSDDPDLQRRRNNDWPYERLMGWILARAPQLLSRDMADDLLDCERQQRDYKKRNRSNPFITAAWPVAAAQLQPGRGRTILKAAWARFDGDYDGDNRVSLMAALAASGDARDFKFIAAWYFAPAPVKWDGSVNGGKSSEFFGRLPHRKASRATRRLVARLIRDKRFDAAKYGAVKAVAELVNAWSVSPIFDIHKRFDAVWRGNENDPPAFAAAARVRAALRQTSAIWSA